MKGGMEGCAADVVCGVDVDCPDCSVEQLRELTRELHQTPIPGSTFPLLAFGEQDTDQVDGGGKKKNKKTNIQSGGRYFTNRFIIELKALLVKIGAGAVSCRSGMILFLRWVAGAAVQRGTSNPLSIFTTWLAQISNLTCVCAIQLIWCFIYYIHFTNAWWAAPAAHGVKSVMGFIYEYLGYVFAIGIMMTVIPAVVGSAIGGLGAVGAAGGSTAVTYIYSMILSILHLKAAAFYVSASYIINYITGICLPSMVAAGIDTALFVAACEATARTLQQDDDTRPLLFREECVGRSLHQLHLGDVLPGMHNGAYDAANEFCTTVFGAAFTDLGNAAPRASPLPEWLAGALVVRQIGPMNAAALQGARAAQQGIIRQAAAANVANQAAGPPAIGRRGRGLDRGRDRADRRTKRSDSPTRSPPSRRGGALSLTSPTRRSKKKGNKSRRKKRKSNKKIRSKKRRTRRKQK